MDLTRSLVAAGRPFPGGLGGLRVRFKAPRWVPKGAQILLEMNGESDSCSKWPEDGPVYSVLLTV